MTPEPLLLGPGLVVPDVAGQERCLRLEALILAEFARPPHRRPPQHIVDLGTGSTAAAGHALMAPKARLTLVEPEATRAERVQTDAQRQGWADRVTILATDIPTCASHLGRGTADLVVARCSGLDLMTLVSTARQLLGRRGRFCLAIPACLLFDLFAALAEQKLVAKRLRLLHFGPGPAADVAIVEALVARPGGLLVEAPWLAPR